MIITRFLYEVPEQQPDDHPTTVRANDENENNYSSPFVNLISAHNGYSMKAGDILICYGTGGNITGKYVGHAAIASSSKYIMEMPGPFKRAEHTSKENFFRKHTGNDSYVAVYRIKSHPHYANDASSYAYNNMYLKDNPWYCFPSSIYVKSPSYCSKYVYLAYNWGATASSVIQATAASAIVLPHDLPSWFKGSFKPSYIHKVTSW